MITIRSCAWAVLACLGAAGPAVAQGPAHPPYKPVEVLLPSPQVDRTLDAFRRQLAAIAQKRDRAALARLVAKDFFWEGDFGGQFNAKKPAIDNLALALRLADGGGGAGRAAGAPAPRGGGGALAATPRCAPANPNYDDAELAAVTDATKTDVMDWSYPRVAGLAVRARPDAGASVIETLGLHLVRVLGQERKKGEAAKAWTRIATPAGKVGYVEPGALLSPLTDRLCFGKDAGGAWRIVGYVGAGD